MPSAPARAAGSTAAVVSALVLSVVLAVAALVDQVAIHSLTDHADAMYAPHGKDPSAGLLYGLLYTVAAVGVLLFWLSLRAVRSGSRWATALIVGSAVVMAGLAAVLLASSEYGEQIYPPVWGVLALLPPVAAVAGLLAPRRTAR